MYFDDNGAMHVFDDNIQLITNINQATLSLNDNHYINNIDNKNSILNSNKEPLIEFNSNNIIFNKNILTEYSMGTKKNPFQNIYCSNIYLNSNVNLLQKLNNIDNAKDKFIEDFVYKKPRLPLSKNITVKLTEQLVYNLYDNFSGQIDTFELITNFANVRIYNKKWLKINPTNTKGTYTIITSATNTTGTNTWKINIIETIRNISKIKSSVILKYHCIHVMIRQKVLLYKTIIIHYLLE